jgi:hypothetical protein
MIVSQDLSQITEETSNTYITPSVLATPATETIPAVPARKIELNIDIAQFQNSIDFPSFSPDYA